MGSIVKKNAFPLFSLLACCLFAAFGPSARADTVTAQFPRFAHHPGNVFTRMFPDLPPFAAQTDDARRAVQRLGAINGVLDAQDDLSDPVQSVANPTVFSPNNRDNPRMTAGVTFFGQFLDHDITFDKRSQIGVNAAPGRTVNFRSPAFDLDSVYGAGPEGSPELYETESGRIKFILEPIAGSEAVSRHGAVRTDLPRDASGNAIVAESRNDENLVISQMQVALLSFHNAVTDFLAGQPEWRDASAERLFEEARRLVTWHYQWIILHEFLPLTLGQERVDRILSDGLKYYQPYAGQEGERREADMPGIPLEFSVAAYRFGHSQARPSYRANFGPTGGAAFFALLFDDFQDPASSDPADLRGGKRAPRRFIDWQTFFDFGDGNVRFNKRIDSKLSSVLMALPGARAASPGLPDDGLQSLPARSLTRHVNFGLPSGQAVASRMGMPALTPGQLPELAPYALDSRTTMDTSTPLFYYVLKEAELMEDGLRLGPVGAAIVGEVFVGLLRADRNAYLAREPDWQPTLPGAEAGAFRMTDLLRFAGVVPPL